MGSPSAGAGGQTSGLGSQSGVSRQGTGTQGGTQGSRGESEESTSAGGKQPFGRATQPGSNERTSNQLIGGVRSKSKARSIRELNGRNRYDQWEFVYIPYNPNPLPPGTGGNAPGQQPRAPGQQRPGSSRPGRPRAVRSGPAPAALPSSSSIVDLRYASVQPNSSTTASCRRGRNVASRAFSRVGCTRFVSSTT